MKIYLINNYFNYIMSIIFNKIYYSITDSTVIQIIIIQEYKYKIIINYGTYYMDIFSIYQTKEINHINTIPKYLLLLFDLIFDYHSTFQDIYYQLNISLKNYSNEDSKNIKIGNLSIKYNNLLNDYNIIINKSQIKYNNLVTESEIKYNNLLNDYNTLKNEPNIKYIIITILLITILLIIYFIYKSSNSFLC